MTLIMARDLPDDALLQRYAQDPKTYTDCLTRDVAGVVNLETYVAAFYASRLFKVERVLLGWILGRPATDAQAKDMVEGHTNAFSGWTVEGRTGQQLLMSDLQGHTRSWFMVAPDGSGTRLYFGSAVINKDHVLVRLLMPFHDWYARALLRAVKLP